MKLKAKLALIAIAGLSLFVSGGKSDAQTLLIPEKPWFSESPNPIEPCTGKPGPNAPDPLVKLPGTWNSYIWFADADTSPTPPFCPFRPKADIPIPPVYGEPIPPQVNSNPDIYFDDVKKQLAPFIQGGKQLVIGGWTIQPIDPAKSILDFEQDATSGAGSLKLTNLKASRAATGLDTLNIYWGAKFIGPIPPSGLSVWKIKQSMNNVAKEDTLGFASKVDQYGWFQKNINNINPGQIIATPSAVIHVPINTTGLKVIQGSRSITQWGGSGPSVAGYRLYGRTDLRIHNGYVEFPNSSVIEVLGPPPPPDFYFIPPGGQLDNDNINDVVLFPEQELSFDVIIDTTGVTLPHDISDYQDILVEWDYQYDPSELELVLDSNPSGSIIGINDMLVSTLKFKGVNPGIDPHDGINDFGITLKDVIYRSSLWGDYSVFSQFPAPNKDALNNSGTDFNQVVEVQTPGPLPILGAGATFGFSRKLRKRIKGYRMG